MSTSEEEIENRTTYHAVSTAGVIRITEMRQQARAWMNLIIRWVPEGREQSLALTKIEEALMWSNAGIARHPSLQEELE